MRKHTGRNPDFDPNMLIILLLILNAYSQRPIYYCEKDLRDSQHNRASNNDASKASDISYTGSVLSKENDSQDEAESNIIDGSSPGLSRINDIGYTRGLSGEEDCLQSTDCSDTISSEVVPEYPNKLIIPNEGYEHMVVNVPVLLSQFEIEFACETTIKLDCPALEIKRIKKNVYLEECKLLPKANKLFIAGIVRKNIEYSTEDNIRHITAEVPFKCTTQVEYFTPPIISSNYEQLEIETLREDGIGADISEKTFISREHFNEKIYCKLVSDAIEELDIASEHGCEKLFETFIEKMVIKLNLKLIQEQEININK